MNSIVASLGSLARTVIPRARRQILYVHCSRPFSTSPQVRDVGDLSAFTAAFRKTTVFSKLANHPEAVNSIRALMETMQEAGVDMSAGAQPSKFQMAKLLMSSKFREQMRVVAEEMKKAGVDINSREVMDEFLAMKQAAQPPK